MKPNHIQIRNLTELKPGESCKVIRIEMDGCAVGSVEPGETFDIKLPDGSQLTVRESISAVLVNDSGVVKGKTVWSGA